MANSTFRPFIRKGGAALIHAMDKGNVRYAPAIPFMWSQVVDFAESPGNVGAVALDADGSSTVNLHTAYPDNLFPKNVVILWAGMYLQTDISGGVISAATVDFGDAGTADGLLDGTNVFTGATNSWSDDSDEPEQDAHLETAFVPALTIATTTGNTNTITAGKLELFIMFVPLPEVAPA
jgi:hypothetical protein